MNIEICQVKPVLLVDVPQAYGIRRLYCSSRSQNVGDDQDFLKVFALAYQSVRMRRKGCIYVIS